LIKSFDELLVKVATLPKRHLAVAAAHDLEVLEAVSHAVSYGLVNATLVGKRAEIERIAQEHGIDLSAMEIIDAEDNIQAARKAVELVSTGQAHMLMKGIVDTANLLRAVLDKEIGLRTGNLICHVAVMEIPGLDRLIFMTDGGMNIAPTLEQKADILQSALAVARKFGVVQPKVVPLAAFEQVNPKMQATVDGQALHEMALTGEFGDALVSGPLAFDGALVPEAAKHKGIKDPAAGYADIILVPFIEVGNVMYKSLVYFGNTKVAGIVVGAKKPIVLTSRSDTPEAKFRSIAVASYMAIE
jgi:phosphate butyryltransferase